MIVNTEKIEGFEADVFVALDPYIWRNVHEIARQLFGPTEMVYSTYLGRQVERPTVASGSGIQTCCERLVERGIAMEKKDILAPMGRVWKRWP